MRDLKTYTDSYIITEIPNKIEDLSIINIKCLAFLFEVSRDRLFHYFHDFEN